MSNTPFELVVSSLCFAYSPDEPVLVDTRCVARSGAVHAIMGPSGCGKSTLLRLIAGLERPDAGSITIDGRCVCGKGVFVPPEKRAVGVVFQDAALFPHQSAISNVMFGMRGGTRRSRRTDAMELLGLLGLESLADARPHTLSGGQQTRVAIARSLARRPRVLLLDEPFSGLDGSLRDSVRDAVLDRVRAARIVTLLVTHDEADVESMCEGVTTLPRNTAGAADDDETAAR